MYRVVAAVVLSIVMAVDVWLRMASDEGCTFHLYAGMPKTDVIRLCGKPKRTGVVIENREEVERWYYRKVVIDLDSESKLMGYQVER